MVKWIVLSPLLEMVGEFKSTALVNIAAKKKKWMHLKLGEESWPGMKLTTTPTRMSIDQRKYGNQHNIFHVP